MQPVPDVDTLVRELRPERESLKRKLKEEEGRWHEYRYLHSCWDSSAVKIQRLNQKKSRLW